MSVDWDYVYGQNECYKNIMSRVSTLDDVAGCLSVIPKELDTPVLKEIRSFVEDYGAHPQFVDSDTERYLNPIKANHLITGKKGEYVSYTPEHLLRDVRSRIRWMLNDFPYDVARICNSEWDGKKDILIEKEGKRLAQADEDSLLTMRKLGKNLESEQYDGEQIVSAIFDIAKQKWIDKNAWDLTTDELKDIDIKKEMGLE